MKQSALRKRAVAAGVGELALEDTLDSDDPKAAVIALICELEHAKHARG
jgi:hypothetical protein